ncbi:MAG: P-II family nitrogen regulator [Chloroflexi bacterium]|nr:P-II family nitrogen regulator [Chloroflexota bacterium]
MKMILFVLHDPGRLDEVLTAWEEAGISGITVLPSTGLGRIRNHEGLREDVPLFPDLEDFFPHHEQTSRTLFTVVKDEEQARKVVQATQRVVGDLDQPDTGLLVIWPLAQVYGLVKKRISEPKRD